MKTNKIMKFICFFSFLFFSVGIFAQNVTGQVTDEANVPIAGANIVVKGTSTGAVTDFDGSYSIKASNGDVLVFSYVGYATQQVTVSGSTVNVTLVADLNSLDQIIVSSSRKPVRKLQATTAINSVTTEEIAALKPESFTEAIQNVPGVTINETLGRKGGFVIRGFPGGNIYTTTLIDGLPASGTAGLSSGTQEFFGIDPNVQNIEVVRGAAATLFGRAAAAGAINIISKMGGTEHKGSVAFTKYNSKAGEGHQFEDEVDYRLDMNFNGPISEKLRYNIGGYVLEDSGVKEQFRKDRGAQIRANFDWLISDKITVRVSGGYFNNQFQPITDAPWDLANESTVEGWNTTTTFFNDRSAIDRDLGVRAGFFDPTTATDANGVALRDNPGDNREKAAGGNAGVDFNIEIGSGWSFSQRLKYNSFIYEDIQAFNFSTFYDINSTVNRFNGAADNQTRDLITETRISKQIKGSTAEHNITGGLFYSKAKRDRFSINNVYGSDVTFRNPTVVVNGFATGSFSNPNLPWTSYVSGTSSHREEASTGLFIGNEMVFNEKLSVNVAFRYDWLKTSFNNDPEESRSTGIDFDPVEFDSNELTFEDYSYSIGANYLLGESSAVYGNYLRAFSLPGGINITTELPEDNEIVSNLELGYRAGLGDLTVDATFFNTSITNRSATVFDGDNGVFVSRPAGENKISGGELALSYTPKAVKGLIFRGALTLSKSEYETFLVPLNSATDPDNIFGLTLVTADDGSQAFDVKGNQVQNRPKTIYNLNVGYNRARWGADFGGFTYSGAYADVLNLYELPTMAVYNLGGYVNFPLDGDLLTLSLRVKNIFDGENARQLVVGGQDGDAGLRELQANPDPTGRFTSAIYQNPKRVLFTVGYKF